MKKIFDYIESSILALLVDRIVTTTVKGKTENSVTMMVMESITV